jgi:hypothetical protein
MTPLSPLQLYIQVKSSLPDASPKPGFAPQVIPARHEEEDRFVVFPYANSSDKDKEKSR